MIAYQYTDERGVVQIELVVVPPGRRAAVRADPAPCLQGDEHSVFLEIYPDGKVCIGSTAILRVEHTYNQVTVRLEEK